MLTTIKALAQNNFKAGDTFKGCPSCPETVVIPAGAFMIGSPQDEVGRFDVEGPQKKIVIKQFAAGRFDVTLAQWKTFVNATNRPVVGGCAWSGFKDTSRKDWDANPDASWHISAFHRIARIPLSALRRKIKNIL